MAHQVTDDGDYDPFEGTSRLLHAISDGSRDVIFAKDRQGRMRFANPATLALIGKSAEEVLGRTDAEFLDDREAARRVMENDRSIMESGVESELEEVIAGPDGGVRVFRSQKRPYRDAAGEVVGLLGISRDVTGQKQAEQRLSASETRYRTLFENMTEGFALGEAIVDASGAPCDFRFLEVNAAFARQSGLSRDILGRPITEILPRLERHWIERYCSVALTGTPLRFADYNADTNRHYEVFCYSPSPRQFAILFRDVTEERRASEERERLYRAAEEANRAKDEFLATLSHELRTPLTAILGWARLLEHGGLSDAMTHQAHATIARNAEAQRKLLSDVLDVSRMIAGRMRLEVRDVDALDVIDLAAASIQPAVDAKDLQLEIVPETSSTRIAADPDRLQQIVWNLLSNAVKFTPRGGRITVGVRRHEGSLEIGVSDTGIGVPPAFLPKLFTRFAQADSSPSRRHGGLGLGLSIVRHLVELHGGKVSAESAGEEKGATFSFSLPVRAAGARRAVSAPPAAREPAAPRAANLLGLEVLVVDDVEDARTMIAAILEGAGGRVTLASGGEEALRQLERSKPHLILADIGMPGMNGYEFVQRLRAMPPSSGGSTPAVALTAFGGDADRVRALAAGFDDHIPKPVAPDELLDLAERASRRSNR